MSYLLDFVKSFDENELLQFRLLDVIGKEELVRDEYLNRYKDSGFDESSIATKLNLTAGHFDKVNSILLNKIIEKLYGRNYNLIFSSILQKGLTDLMLHELKIAERYLQKSGFIDEKTRFYKAAFENLRSMFHPRYNSRLTHTYGKKYLDSLGNGKKPEDEIYVSMLTLYGDIISQKFAGNEVAFLPKATAVLGKYEKKALMPGSSPAKFFYYFTLATLHKHLSLTNEGMLPAYYEALKAFDENAQRIESKFKGIVLCELGFANLERNEFGKAQEFYEQGLLGFPDTIGKSHYHGGNYFVTCLINRDYRKAQGAFKKYLLPKIQPATNRSVLFDMYMLGCLLHLHIKDYSGAFKYLIELQKYRKKEITHFGLAMMRLYECVYFYRTSDYSTAARLVRKNLKFLNKEIGDNPSFEYYLQYIDCIGKLIKLKQQTLRSPEKLSKQIESLQQGIFTVFNRLLED